MIASRIINQRVSKAKRTTHTIPEELTFPSELNFTKERPSRTHIPHSTIKE
jgi:hypothetical protein